MEKILEINEVHNIKFDKYSGYDGYEIITDKQKIQFLISNSQNCCENWGYLCSNDDFNDFIGAELKEITETDTSLKTQPILEYGFDEGDVIFINLETDRGTLQFAVYNAHNGYYGHSVKFVSDKLTLDTGL